MVSADVIVQMSAPQKWCCRTRLDSRSDRRQVRLHLYELRGSLLAVQRTWACLGALSGFDVLARYIHLAKPKIPTQSLCQTHGPIFPHTWLLNQHEVSDRQEEDGNAERQRMHDYVDRQVRCHDE